MSSPPKSIPPITRHEAMPESTRIAAPTRHASVDVSPMQPGIVPRNAAVHVGVTASMPVATLAVSSAVSGVALV